MVVLDPTLDELVSEEREGWAAIEDRPRAPSFAQHDTRRSALGPASLTPRPRVTILDALLGEPIDGYVLQELLGEGSTSTVYRARDAEGRSVAIKILRPECITEPLRERFLREGRAQFEHRNVVRTLGAGFTRLGTPYIALELLDGVTFDQRLKGRPLPPKHALDVVRQATRGVAATHRLGVIHRDIKPANIFCCRDGTVKVLDFGVAHWAELASGSTETGQIFGTLLYFAPEQLMGAKGIDARADVWALGMILYHALVGSLPFARKTPFETALAIARDPLPPLGRHVPSTLAAVVDQCVQKHPDDRLPNAIALGAVLDIIRV